MDKVNKYVAKIKKATKLVGQIGLFDPKKGLPIELQQSGYIGSVTYKNQNVNIQGKPFSAENTIKNKKDSRMTVFLWRHHPDLNWG